MNCFRFLDYKNFYEVDMLSIPEYELLMKAVRLKEADKDYRNHLQAFLNIKAGAKKKAGKGKEKLVFAKFDKFYNRKEAIDEIMTGNNEKRNMFSRLAKFMKKEGMNG